MSNPSGLAPHFPSAGATADKARRLQMLTLALRILLVVAIVLLAAGPWLFDLNQLTLLTEFFTLLVLALMWNLLAGYADIVTVGQQGFVGVGAYAFFGLAVLAGLDPFLSIILAAVITAVLAVPALLFILRLRLAYLAVGTWVLADVLSLIAGKLPGFGGGSGVSLPISIARAFGGSMSQRVIMLYMLAFILAAAALVATWCLLRSRVGLGLTAMRDNEDGAKSAGVDVPRMRVICFLWTAPFLGLAGALVTLQKLRIAPSASFSITDWTIFIIFVVVIGGIGSLEGPIIGTALFLLLREYLADFGAWYLILLGAVSIAVILIEPRGLWGIWRRFFPIDVIPVSHKSPIITTRISQGHRSLNTAAYITPKRKRKHETRCARCGNHRLSATKGRQPGGANHRRRTGGVDARRLRGWRVAGPHSRAKPRRDAFFRPPVIQRCHGGCAASLPRHDRPILDGRPRSRPERARQCVVSTA